MSNQTSIFLAFLIPDLICIERPRCKHVATVGAEKMDYSESDDEAMIGSLKVAARYNHKCRMTLYRWMQDEKLNFPQPVKINRRWYWNLGELRAWERSRAKRGAA
jgi:predicted DNA-binding transcriptional regulator AlpA